MNKVEKILLISKEQIVDNRLLRKYSDSLAMTSAALELLTQRKAYESNEDAIVVRKLMFFAMGFMTKTEHFYQAVLANTDYDLLFGLRTAFESPDKFLAGESLNSISTITRYSILALLHPLQYGFISTVQISMVRSIYPAEYGNVMSELRAKHNSDSHKKCDYEITNRLLSEQYKAAGFDSAAEFSLHIRRIQPRSA